MQQHDCKLTYKHYIVRLLNVSLSPTDSVGRMLHTFSCTAYEIAEFGHDGLVHYNLLSGSEPNQKQMRWETIEFAKDGMAESNRGNFYVVRNGPYNFSAGIR